MFESIGRNKFKTAFIVTIIFVFLSAVTYVISLNLGLNVSEAIIAAVLISLVMSGGSYWFSDRIVLSMHGARLANDRQDKMLKGILEGIVLAAGVPMPTLYVVDDPSPNAFATGRNPKNAVICVTTGLLETLDYYQLEGVLAHELAHIKNYDILLQTVASVMIGAAIILSRFMWRGGSRRRNSDDKNSGILVLIGLVFVILAPIAGQILKMALSRNREYLADATAVTFTRNPEGLATALEKISGTMIPMQSANDAAEGMYIANPKMFGKTDWFSTHPPVEKRVNAIRNITK